MAVFEPPFSAFDLLVSFRVNSRLQSLKEEELKLRNNTHQHEEPNEHFHIPHYERFDAEVYTVRLWRGVTMPLYKQKVVV